LDIFVKLLRMYEKLKLTQFNYILSLSTRYLPPLIVTPHAPLPPAGNSARKPTMLFKSNKITAEKKLNFLHTVCVRKLNTYGKTKFFGSIPVDLQSRTWSTGYFENFMTNFLVSAWEDRCITKSDWALKGSVGFRLQKTPVYSVWERAAFLPFMSQNAPEHHDHDIVNKISLRSLRQK